jgi:hypothetical protein
MQKKLNQNFSEVNKPENHNHVIGSITIDYHIFNQKFLCGGIFRTSSYLKRYITWLIITKKRLIINNCKIMIRVTRRSFIEQPEKQE